MGSEYIVYVLRCEPGNKYYIGFSSQFDHRIRQHFAGDGAKFTRRYSPIELVEKHNCKNENHAKYLEKKITMKYASNYGRRNVSGAGGFSKVL